MRIYFSGIGGVGIGPLAEIALSAGYQVVGSDMQPSPMTSQLERRGVKVYYGQTGQELAAEHQTSTIGLLVHTSAMSEQHPELATAHKLGIPTAKRDHLIAKIIKEKQLKLIAVAGTHGKTTTVGMIVWAMQQLGIAVSYSIGTTTSFGPSGLFEPSSQYFVYECDEFDRNFLNFWPDLSVITSIGYDHPDTYPTKLSYDEAFGQFAKQSSRLVAWQKDFERLGLTNSDAIVLASDQVEPLELAGQHNRQNASLALAAIDSLGLASRGEILRQLESFPGMSRRFEKIAIGLYSDYGHHPDEIKATLQMARELSKSVVLVYQPHQNVRQHEIRHLYTDEVFGDASEVYWLPTYLSREDASLPTLTPDDLTSDLSDTVVHHTDLGDQLWDDIQRHIDAGALVLCMGAGSIDDWVREQAAMLRVANVLLIEAGTGKLIMQQRDNDPDVYNPGMVSAFGGSMEDDETTRQAAARELREETSVQFQDTDLIYFKTLFQPLDDGTSRWITIYLLTGIDTSSLEVYEGEGYVLVDPLDIASANLTPSVREAIKHYAITLTSALSDS